jgi:hypothetical protein
MKDINDIDKTVDWIDAAMEEDLTDNERKFLEEGDCTTPNPALDAALSTILNRTITHILNN